jgi:ribosomal protein L44E
MHDFNDVPFPPAPDHVPSEDPANDSAPTGADKKVPSSGVAENASVPAFSAKLKPRATNNKKSNEKKRASFKDNTLVEDSKAHILEDVVAARKKKQDALKWKRRQDAAKAVRLGSSDKEVRDEAARVLAEVDKAELERIATNKQKHDDT